MCYLAMALYTAPLNISLICNVEMLEIVIWVTNEWLKYSHCKKFDPKSSILCAKTSISPSQKLYSIHCQLLDVGLQDLDSARLVVLGLTDITHCHNNM